MSEATEAISSLGLEPISADAPTGESVRYEPEFEQIEFEIGKLESLNGTPVDWRTVEELGVKILSGKSKDLLVAGFLCQALFEQRGYAGLGSGLTLVLDLIETFWQDLFPPLKRLKARGAALDWLVERVRHRVERSKPEAADREALEGILKAIADLEPALNEKLGDAAPSLGDLRRTLTSELEALPAPQPEPAPAPAPEPAESTKARKEAAADGKAETPAPAPAPAVAPAPAQAPAAAPAPAPVAAAPGSIASDTDLQKAVRASQDTLRNIALYKRGKKPADPSSYQMVRQAAWLGLEQLPPDQGGKTEIRLLTAERLQQLKGLQDGGDHRELLEQVEVSLGRAPFWLDGHRLAALALEALGHQEARQAVIESLRAFLSRFPQAPELSFQDGQPFADEVTRLWIKDEVQPQGSGGPARDVGTSGDGEAPWTKAGREAQQMAAKGKVEEAFLQFQGGRTQARSAGERFHWSLALARFCQELGRNDLAIPQLEDLEEEATRFRLEEWEPALSLETARLLLLCYEKTTKKDKATPQRLERIERLKARVIRMDIGSALRFTKS